MSRMLRLTRDQLAGINAKRSPNKFGARKKMVDGITFDSTKEAERYLILKAMRAAGDICKLQTHKQIVCEVNDRLICVYECDFVYEDRAGLTHYEDCKGLRKGAHYDNFRLKAKLVEALHGIKVEVV